MARSNLQRVQQELLASCPSATTGRADGIQRGPTFQPMMVNSTGLRRLWDCDEIWREKIGHLLVMSDAYLGHGPGEMGYMCCFFADHDPLVRIYVVESNRYLNLSVVWDLPFSSLVFHYVLLHMWGFSDVTVFVASHTGHSVPCSVAVSPPPPPLLAASYLQFKAQPDIFWGWFVWPFLSPLVISGWIQCLVLPPQSVLRISPS